MWEKKAPLISILGVRRASCQSASRVRKKILRTLTAINSLERLRKWTPVIYEARDLWMLIYLLIKCCHSSAIATQLQPATLQSTYRTTANRIYRRNARMSYACSGLALYFYMNVGGASRTANSYSVTIHFSGALNRFDSLQRFRRNDSDSVPRISHCLLSISLTFLFERK